MRTNFAVSDGNSGCGLNGWMGAAISRGIELRDEDIWAICGSDQSVIEGMRCEELAKIGAYGRKR
jgi:hypothetical protein